MSDKKPDIKPARRIRKRTRSDDIPKEGKHGERGSGEFQIIDQPKTVEQQLKHVLDRNETKNDAEMNKPFTTASGAVVYRRRKRAPVLHADAEAEIQQVMHILTPLYKRRIFYEQLRARWYVIVIPLIFVLTASIVVPIIIIPWLSGRVTVMVYPPVEPILAVWKVQKFKQNDIAEYANIQDSNFTVDVTMFAELSDAIKLAYEEAELPVESIEITSFKDAEDNSSRTTLKEVFVLHTVHMNQNETIVADYDLEIRRVVKKLRRYFLKQDVWVLDPGQIILSRQEMSVKSSSVENFLNSENPPVDLAVKFSVPTKTPQQSRSMHSNWNKICEPFQPDANMTILPDGCVLKNKIETGMACQFTCNKPDLVLVGSNLRTCLSIGIWSGDHATCEKPCPKLQPLLHGFIAPGHCYLSNSTVTLLPTMRCTFACESGYQLHGSLNRQCTSNGIWSGAMPLCKRTCPGRVSPIGGHVVPSSCAAPTVVEGFMCTFYCSNKYLLHGEISSTCDSYGKWTADTPVCRRKCQHVPSLRNGKIFPNRCIGGNVYDGVTCSFVCDPKYQLVGPSSVICQVDGTWSNNFPVCSITCEPLHASTNLIVTPKVCLQRSTLSSGRCEFECEIGFVLNHEHTLVCQKDGEWNFKQPRCIALCPVVLEAANGNMICSGEREDDSCALACHEGFRLIGASFIICQADGAWSELIGKCVSTCPKLPPPINGYIEPITCSVERSLTGVKCQYHCNSEYGVYGTLRSTCEDTGTWSTNSTTCEHEDQFMIRYEFNRNVICLMAELQSNIVVKEDWSECTHHMKQSTWAIYRDKLIRNAKTGDCITAESTQSMSRLILRPCDENDQMQQWQWPDTAYSKYVVKLEAANLYPWEGYSSTKAAFLTSQVSLATKWLLLKIGPNDDECSFHGAAKQGSCPKLTNSENGRWTPASCSTQTTKHERYCTYKCGYGFEVSGTFTENKCLCGKWTMAEIPQCVPSCKALEIGQLNNGTILPEMCYSQYYVPRGTSCSATCADGFQIEGENGMVCLNNGKWSRPLPQCQRVCPPLGEVEGIIVDDDDLCSDVLQPALPGTTCTFSCDEMLLRIGSTSTTCTSRGTWSGGIPTCKSACTMENVDNSNIVCDSSLTEKGYLAGTNCTITCNAFYVISPINTTGLSCLDNGLWDGNFPVCKRLCSALPVITNGVVEPAYCTQGDVPQDEDCTASCNTPYSLEGPSILKCLPNGLWSGNPPTCKDDIHFLLWHDTGVSKYCIIAIYYSFHKVYKLSLLEYSLCDVSNKMHLWTKSYSTYILQHVGTRWCMETNYNNHIQLSDCDLRKTEQEWECQLVNQNYMLKSLKSGKLLSTDVPTLSVKVREYNQDLNIYSWQATDTNLNEGTACGLIHGANAVCPKLFYSNMDVTPNTCNLLVAIGVSCTATCPTDYTFESGASSAVTSCDTYGLWSIKNLKCKKRFCPSLTLPANSAVSDASCTTVDTTITNQRACTFTCDPGTKLTKEASGNGTVICLPNGEWSENVLSCPQICAKLTPPVNGQIYPATCTMDNEMSAGNTCDFTCDPNYDLVGTKTVICLNGAWDDVEPTCNLKTGSNDCFGLVPPENGLLKPANCYGTSNPGDECSVSCISGYAVLEDVRLVCQSDGLWSAPIPPCQRICPAIDPPYLATVSPNRCLGESNNTVDDVCILKCQKNFKIEGDREIHCKANGGWSGTGQSCIKELQFMIRADKRGTCLVGSSDGHVVNSECDFDNLNQRWAWHGVKQIRNIGFHLCVDVASQNEFMPLVLSKCNVSITTQLWVCPMLEKNKKELHSGNSILRMSILADNINKVHLIGENIDFSNIDSNFTAINETNEGSICLFRPLSVCPTLLHPENGLVSTECEGDSATIGGGTRCTFRCNDGHTLTGPDELKCENDGYWNVNEKTYCRKMCPVISKPEFSLVTPESCSKFESVQGTVCNVSCTGNFSQVGDEVRTCTEDGTWTGIEVVCHSPCPPLGQQPNAQVSPKSCETENQVTGFSCFTTCNTGYALKGVSVQTCGKQGQWSQPQGQCIRKCPQLLSISMGTVEPGDCLNPGKMVGDFCMYTCDNRYDLAGSGLRNCMAGGIWSGPPMKCLRSCSMLHPIPNGVVTCDNSRLISGVSCTYICKPGYGLVGESKRVCSNSGLWSNEVPRCTQEKQFVLIQSSPPNPSVCLTYSVETNSLKLLSYVECSYENEYHRWAWYTENLIRNVGSRKCLQSHSEETGTYIMIKDCDYFENLQHWECVDGQSSGFFRLVEPHLYPLISSMSSYRILLFGIEDLKYIQTSGVVVATHARWFAKNDKTNSTSVCAAREASACGALKLDPNVVVSPIVCKYASVSFGTICNFFCKDSYVIKESYDYVRCLISGYWTKPAPKCVPSCKTFSKDESLILSPNACSENQYVAEGHICNFACPYGGRIVGSPITTCMANGNWSTAYPVCLQTCHSLNEPHNGFIEPSECTAIGSRLLQGFMCSYKCHQAEHKVSRSNIRMCTSSGRWTGYHSNCVKPCSPLADVPGAEVLPSKCIMSNSLYGTICSFTCKEPLLPAEPQYRTCQANSTWSGTKAICEPPCDMFQTEENSVVIFYPSDCTQQPQVPGSQCQIKCISEYDVVGNNIATCQKDGTWDKKFGICARKCPRLEQPQFGLLTPSSCLGSNIYEGITCVVACQPGYMIQGSDTRVCLNNGNWTGQDGKCVRSCPNIVDDFDGKLTPENCTTLFQEEGSICKAKCPYNHVMISGKTEMEVTCQIDGTWSNDIPDKCYRTCPEPQLVNSHIHCTNLFGKNTTVYTQNTVCKVTCYLKFAPTSRPISKCLLKPGTITADWEPQISECIYAPDPMIIIQRIGFDSSCLGAGSDNAEMIPWVNCSSNSASIRWIWHFSNHILNTEFGLCLTSASSMPDDPIVMDTCDINNDLQMWDCDKTNPFKLNLFNYNMGPASGYNNYKKLTLQEDKGIHSLFYTYNPITEDEIGTLCSRQPAATCPGLKLTHITQVFQSQCTEDNVVVGTVCQYKCPDTSYAVVGPGVVTCDDSGEWLPTGLSECIKTCPPINFNEVMFTDKRCSHEKQISGKVCSLKCEQDFTLAVNSVARVTCLSTGEWSGEVNGTCVKNCNLLLQLENGHFVPSPCFTGTCKVECHEGFRLQGSKYFKCLVGGVWEDTEYSCVKDIQFRISTSVKPLMTDLCLTVLSETAVSKQFCVKGHISQLWRWYAHDVLQSIENEKCLSRKASFRMLETNTTESNDMLIYFRNSTVDSDVFLSTCDIDNDFNHWSCGGAGEEFKIQNTKLYLGQGPQFASRVILLQNSHTNDQWFGKDYLGTRTVCSYRLTGVCAPITQLYGGNVYPSVCQSQFTVPGTKCYFRCNNKFVIEGSNTVTCQENGLWTGNFPNCLGIGRCKGISLTKGLKVSPKSCGTSLSSEGQICKFSCQNDHYMIGNPTLQCLTSMGRWSGDKPICKLKCPPIPPPINGTILPDDCQHYINPLGTVCNFTCDETYEMIGSDSRICLEGGQWSHEPTLCRKKCFPFTVSEFATVEPEVCTTNKSRDGKICRIACNTGYSLSGSSLISCRNGIWSSEIPDCLAHHCVKYDSEIEGISQITYTNTKNEAITKGTIMQISCDDGYKLSSGSKKVCLKDGTWSGHPKICGRIKCPPLSKLYHGNIMPSECANGYVSIGMTCVFSCEDGYALVGSSSVTCKEEGIWSQTNIAECHDTHVSVNFINFILVSKEIDTAIEDSLCLGIVEEILLKLVPCEPATPFIIWRWYGSFHMQNLANQFCLSSINGSLYTASIGMRKCDLNDTNQRISCGDIDSRPSRLHLKIHKYFMTNLINGFTVVEDKSEHVNWAAIPVTVMSRKFMNSKGSQIHEDEYPTCTFMCGGNFSDPTGNIASPNFPNPYPPDTICQWLITVPGKILSVDFSMIRLGEYIIEDKYSENCRNDYMLVTEGETSNLNYYDKNLLVCGEHLPTRITSLHGRIHIETYSDHNPMDNKRGFTATWSTTDLPEPLEDCGLSNSLYLQGESRYAIMYPWQVIIFTRNGLCDGVFISNQIVLTSAHCVDHIKDATKMRHVQIAHKITTQSELLYHKKRNGLDHARKIFIHKKYNQDWLTKDMALMVVNTGITKWNETVSNGSSICFSDNKMKVVLPGNKDCVVVGVDKSVLTTRTPTWIFTTVERVEILSKRYCNHQLYERNGVPLDDSFLCTQSIEENEQNTKYISNDGGSVLQCSWNGNWYVVGVSSFEMHSVDHKVRKIRVFSSVQAEREWIQKTLDNAFLDPSNIF